MRKEGFTLVELLVAIGVMSVLVLVSTNLLVTTLTTDDKQQSILDATRNGRLILAKVTAAAKGSSSAVIPQPSTLQLSGTDCTTFSWTGVGQPVLMAVETGSGCTPPALGTNKISGDEVEVEDLTFVGSPPGEDFTSVEVNLSLSSTYPLADDSLVFKTTVALRQK